MNKKSQKKINELEAQLLIIEGQKRKLDERYIELSEQLKMAKNSGINNNMENV